MQVPVEIDFRHCEVSEEIYFHRNAVLDGAFDRLSIGSEVAFVEEEGEKGPQASTIRLIGKHHLLGSESRMADCNNAEPFT